MKALITLNGIPLIDTPKSVLNVEYDSEDQLISKLKQMQSGYSLDERDKPKIKRFDVPSKKDPSKMRKVIDCSSYADWHHVAHIGVTSPKVLTEILSIPKGFSKGDKFKCKYFPTDYTIEIANLTGADYEENTLTVWIYKGPSIDNSDGSWIEYWNLQHTIASFERNEYHSLKRQLLNYK